ncbi:hypothetical protein [Stenotrophomonas maltophilia]|uniref:hypothetical protein n=1 Tax=Stenotrophomonas maltophilia TaxID=40324 RepID=UPI0007EF070B|nr:hypothetical protein [Stenotrophomonas maltophilia]OBU52840.1 hypothetical protein A9K69_13660 [Stenotrophomonas maltophilia]
MTLSLKEQLKHWGHYQEHRFCAPLAPEEASSRDEHPLARAQQFAQGTKRERRPLLRDGHARRMLLGAGAGRVNRNGAVLPVASWAVDPIPCAETRVVVSRSATAAVMVGSPDEYRWIDRALSDLYRQNMVRALVVLEEFTGRGSQAQRAAAVAKKLGAVFTKWQYRKELDKGMAFMEARRA